MSHKGQKCGGNLAVLMAYFQYGVLMAYFRTCVLKKREKAYARVGLLINLYSVIEINQKSDQKLTRHAKFLFTKYFYALFSESRTNKTPKSNITVLMCLSNYLI